MTEDYKSEKIGKLIKETHKQMMILLTEHTKKAISILLEEEND